MGDMSPELGEREGEWIEKVLLGSNRASLLDQIRRILDSFGGEVLRFCGVPTDREEFARTIRDTRNFFIHLPSDRPARVPDGRDLIVLHHASGSSCGRASFVTWVSMSPRWSRFWPAQVRPTT